MLADEVQRSPVSGTGAPWWKGAAIYQIYPRSFADSNGDGVGDLPGITAHLDYVASLGVEAIWLSPFFTSPMRDFGYDVADYCGVDPVFGSLADFDALVERAHALGLKVMIDQVYSHSSDQHPWFKESRSSRENLKADWYVWADAKPDGSPPNNWQSVFGGPAWQWDARRGQYYLHNFLAEQPDLNLHNPDVQAAILASRNSGSTAASTASGSTQSISRCTTRSSATIRPHRRAAGGLVRSISSSTSTISHIRRSSISWNGCAGLPAMPSPSRKSAATIRLARCARSPRAIGG